MRAVTSLDYRRGQIAVLAAAALALPLGACSTLPSSGPTGGQIIAEQRDPAAALPFQLVELVDLASVPSAAGAQALPAIMSRGTEQPSDLIGPGDVLDIVIYEAGITLFSGGGAGVAGQGYDPSAKAEKFPPLRVDDEGYITLPYVGRINASGRTRQELQDMIVGGLAGKSQSPQAIVAVAQSITNSVVVGGEVTRAGRLQLATNRETLQDVIALAGGYRGEASELVVRLERQGESWMTRLGSLLRSPLANMRIFPADRILLLREAQSFSVLGAPGQVSQLPFNKDALTLAEAVARAGGAHPNLGDPAAIFVFRYVIDAQGIERPVVYHLNMMKAGGFFLAQKFEMRDKDVLYIGNARANQPSKLVQIISQLFTPLVIVRDVIR